MGWSFSFPFKSYVIFGKGIAMDLSVAGVWMSVVRCSLFCQFLVCLCVSVGGVLTVHVCSSIYLGGYLDKSMGFF